MQSLKALKNWLVWRLLPGEKKFRKVPYYPDGRLRERQGTPSDRAAMVTYDEAVAAQIAGGYTGVGFALFGDTGVVALDFDNVVKDGVIQADVRALCEGTYSEISPSGNGVRAFMRGSLVSRKDSKGEPFGIEVFGTTGFVTFTGQRTEDCELFGDEVCGLTPAVMAMYRERFGAVSAAGVELDENDAFLMGARPKSGLTVDVVRKWLAHIDPGCDRNSWLHYLMAIHHEFDGSSDALDAVVEWSARAANFSSRRDVESVWNSFRVSANPVTIGWIKHRHPELANIERHVAADTWRDKLIACTDKYALRETLCPAIAADPLVTKEDRVILAGTLKAVFKDAFDIVFPIANCREMLAQKFVKKVYVIDLKNADAHFPPWATFAKGWIYVTDEEKYFLTDSDEWLTPQSFNARFTRCLPSSDDKYRTAHHVALNELHIQVVTRRMYWPAMGPIFSDKRTMLLNKYQPSSLPLIKGIDQGAIDFVDRHIGHVCSGREKEKSILLSWLAHNVQFPGKKIRFAPVIKGIEGDGKSVIGSLLKAAMGSVNVNLIGTAVIGTTFNGYGEGACVGILEEIKMHGKGRHDVMNQIKVLITNDEFQMHRKGKDPYTVPNTMNYMAFTNWSDALPLSDTDRRWFVLNTPFSVRSDMDARYGKDHGAYFNRLHDIIEKQAGSLRHWLLNYQLHPDFNPNGTAPHTSDKATMTAMSKSEEETAIAELVSLGGVGITESVICSSYLSTAILASDLGIDLKTTALNRALISVGYVKVPSRQMWNERLCWIWVKGHQPVWTAELKTILNTTLSLSEPDYFN